MSESETEVVDTQDETEDEAQAPSELDTLKARADLLGLDYHHKIGADKLRKQIRDHLEPPVETPPAKQEDEAPLVQTPNAAMARSTILQGKKKEANKLVRIRVTCMNPNKREWEGEIFAAGNRYIGNIKKYIPFDNAEGWHVPQILVDVIKSKRFQMFVERRNARGDKYKQGKLIPEYSVEIMPSLTEKQLEELARKQALNHSIDSDD